MKKSIQIQTKVHAGGKCNNRCKADGYAGGLKDAFGTCTCHGNDMFPITHSAIPNARHWH